MIPSLRRLGILTRSSQEMVWVKPQPIGDIDPNRKYISISLLYRSHMLVCRHFGISWYVMFAANKVGNHVGEFLQGGEATGNQTAVENTTNQHTPHPSKCPVVFLGVQPFELHKKHENVASQQPFSPWILQPCRFVWLMNRWPGSCGNCGFWDPKRGDVGGFDQGNWDRCLVALLYYIHHLGGGFKDSLFSPLPGEMIQFD